MSNAIRTENSIDLVSLSNPSKEMRNSKKKSF